jgi:hypothetical protein
MRRLIAIAALLAGLTASTGSAATHAPLSGTWTGVLTDGTHKERITLTVNGRETRGTWRVSANCRGTLTLDTVSGGSHHYRRHVAPGSSCAGGDIDCLSRTGRKLFDNITPRTNGWSRSGTLHRARPPRPLVGPG